MTSKKRLRSHFYRYLTIGLGGLIGGAGINAFFVPHHLFSGGISGLAMILYFLANLPIGMMIIALNVPLFIAAYRLLDREYVVGALYGMLVFSFATDATRFLAGINLVDDTMLASIYGGVVAGLGSGMVFRVNGSGGGTDIIATIMKKYYGLNVGSVSFAINCLIMLVAGLLFGVKPAMFTLVSMYIGAIVTDKVIEGFNRRKVMMIISDQNDEIAAAILSEIGRGVTFLHGEGAYTGLDKRVIMVVVTTTQIAKIKFLVEDLDSKAFLIVQDAADVTGKGFN
ncbi:MAG TPA: YitT family protein [Patescibacteria group bacterium]|nr:YitT family protein [Patescibacteria group bacterium]